MSASSSRPPRRSPASSRGRQPASRPRPMTCGPASFPARCYGSGGGSVRPFPVGGRSETGPGPRLLEALFGPLVRDQALDPALAVYADIGAEAPQPSVGQLADQLIAEGKRAILLLDNCPRETHDAVAPFCKSAGSTIGLITVDLDIRDENPRAHGYLSASERLRGSHRNTSRTSLSRPVAGDPPGRTCDRRPRARIGGSHG